MMTNDKKVFISYSRQDSYKVDAFVNEISSKGIDIWQDHQSINPADSIVDRINIGLASSDCFVLFASQHYFESAWAQEEFRAAVFLGLSTEALNFVVVLLDEVKLPPLLAHRKYIRFASTKKASDEFIAWYKTYQLGNITSEAPTNLSTILLDWEDIQYLYIDIIAKHILDNLGDLVLKPKSTVVIELGYTKGNKLRIHLTKSILESEIFLAEFKIERDMTIIHQRRINHLKIDLGKGGLGIFTGPYKMNYEDQLKHLENAKLKLREQLTFVCTKLELILYDESNSIKGNNIIDRKKNLLE